MKKLSLLLAAASLSMISCAQKISESMAPALVVNTFKSQFPKASDVEWKKKGSSYEVEFETGLTGRDHEMLIDSTGRMISHKEDISREDLPAAVISSMDKNFAGFKWEDLEKIETPGLTRFKMELKRSGEEWKVLFDRDGKILEKIED